MDHPSFYRTRMGEKFYCKTVPDRAIERLNDLLERLVSAEESQRREKNDADA